MVRLSAFLVALFLCTDSTYARLNLPLDGQPLGPNGDRRIRSHFEIDSDDHFKPLFPKRSLLGGGGGGGGGGSYISPRPPPPPAGGVNTGGTGTLGPQGAQGSTGVQGATGPTGAGVQGPQGKTGSSGVQGPTGSAGSQGDTGPAGAGVQGPTGSDGVQGDTGPAGAGVQGPTGSGGVQGDTGPAGAGVQGPTGPDGVQGDTGPAGAGVQGPQGSAGNQGLAGPQGNIGVGTQGPSGIIDTYTYGGSVNTQTTTGSYIFIGPSQLTITLDSSTKVYANAVAALNSGASAVATSFRYEMCYKLTSSGSLSAASGSAYLIYNLPAGSTSRVSYSTTGIIKGLTGSYQIGPCIYISSGSLSDNDWVQSNYLVFK